MPLDADPLGLLTDLLAEADSSLYEGKRSLSAGRTIRLAPPVD